MNTLDLIARDNWICLNRAIAKTLGVENAIMVGLLASYQRTFGEGFYREREVMIDDSCLTEYAVKKSLRELQDKGILSIEHKGIPARPYYTINTEALDQYIEYRPPRQVDFDLSGEVDFDLSNNNTNNNRDNQRNNKKENNKDTLVGGETDQIQIMFEQFWKEYPRKVSKKTAFTAFKNIKHLKDEFPIIMQAVKLKKGSNDWRKNGGQYIPHPATFIHQERWKDEEQTISSNDSMLSSDNPYFSKETREMLRSMGR